jgi:hypothetical protein
MFHRVKLVGKGASILMGRVVVGGEGVLGVSVLTPSLLPRALFSFCRCVHVTHFAVVPGRVMLGEQAAS